MTSLARPAVLRPLFKRGRWNKAKLSARRQAKLRNSAIAQGTYAKGATLEAGGWDPEWDKRNAPNVMREPKGSILERRRPANAERIRVALDGMDERIAEWRLSNKKPVFDNIWEKLAHESGMLVEGELNKKMFRARGEDKKGRK